MTLSKVIMRTETKKFKMMKLKDLDLTELKTINGGCSSGRVGHMFGACWAKFRNWLENSAADDMIELVDSNGGAIAGYSA